ncbi:MAG: hypothetical protein E6G01_13535 [Actinobacteria bacterium]|nr:MAG: hypothetical protein E6G01_13535 [Actinomycetota bacterium]
MADLELQERLPAHPQPALDVLRTYLADRGRRAVENIRPALRTVARPLGLYLASRIVVATAIGVVIALHIGLSTQHFHGSSFPLNPPKGSFFEALGMFDGAWYMHIAAHGYSTQLQPIDWSATPSVAFLPLLPVLLRITVFVTGLNILYAGVLTTFVIGAVASVCVWVFVRRITDARIADRATALWCFFPGAMTLSLVYTEGLLVVLAVICLFALMRGRWLVAGLAAAAASATAPEGLALTACCAWAAGAAVLHHPARDDREGPEGFGHRLRRGRWFPLLAPVLAPTGWITYQAYLWHRTGDIKFWYRIENEFWQGGFHPWTATVDKARLAFDHPGMPDYLVPTIGLFVLVAAAILLWHWKPPAVVTIYAAVAMALVLSSGPLGARPRFFIAAFPFVVALARPARGPGFSALLGTAAGCLGLLTLIITAGVTAAQAFTP